MARFSPYWLWLLLALPSIGFTYSIMSSTDPKIFNELLHPTGEFSARFLIIAMLASPLALVFRNSQFPRWLKKNRRYFGVAAFGYAALHTLFYLIDKGALAPVLSEFPELSIWTGWVAFVIFIPLAATSMDYFVRSMGKNWKLLQRSTYVAALLTLLHWAALNEWSGTTGALIHFGPLAVLEAYRLWYWYLRPRKSRTTNLLIGY
tara:strand:- start:385 stop:999 length:615 start_codon:yes stop_codon:yes gene_type:complete